MIFFSRNILCLISLIILLAFVGCAEPFHQRSSSDHSQKNTYTLAKASYDIALISVDRPPAAKEKYGAATFGEMGNDETSKYFFQDAMVRIEWTPTALDIAFLLNNNLDDPISILWDEARFSDEEGDAHGILHSGISLDERYHSKPPTTVSQKGQLKDFLYPADYIQAVQDYTSRSRNRAGEREKKPILPTQQRGTAEEFKAKTDLLIGKTLQVLLPLQVESVRYDYLFTFKIVNVSVTEEEHKQEKNSEGKGGGRKSGRGMRFP